MVALRAQLALTLALGATVLACEPKLVVGEKQCPPLGDAMAILSTDPITYPWNAGFETDFCEFTQAGGYCTNDARASELIVSSPVHGGRFAASFTVDNTDGAGYQSRCVRRGVLPVAAYYGAWFYLPKLVDNPGKWNLFHFEGGDPADQKNAHELWDASLHYGSNGELQAFVFQFLSKPQVTWTPTNPPAVPIATWFHLQMYLERAADATGTVRLYQDGALLVEIKDVITDDTEWGEWYVGNFSKTLMAPESTLYVDDVSIRDTL
ncbi:MAG: hypothetical protein ABW061_16990 [Polyangiaceae bacterium]